MVRLNCWQFQECGLEPGGDRAHKLGVCPAAAKTALDGVNEGKNGGRICWIVAETRCSEGHSGSALTDVFCMDCEFYRKVKNGDADGTASLEDRAKAEEGDTCFRDLSERETLLRVNPVKRLGRPSEIHRRSR